MLFMFEPLLKSDLTFIVYSLPGVKPSNIWLVTDVVSVAMTPESCGKTYICIHVINNCLDHPQPNIYNNGCIRLASLCTWAIPKRYVLRSDFNEEMSRCDVRVRGKPFHQYTPL